MSKKTNIEELIKAQQEPFKHVAFSGGGAKGAIYSGVYKALVDSGVSKGVDSVSGSSAGAITATLFSSGTSKKDFKKMSLETNFKNLLGEGNILGISNDGKPLYKLVRDMVKNNVSDYLDNDMKKAKDDIDDRISKITEQEGKESDDNQRKVMQDQLRELQDLSNNNYQVIRDLHGRAQDDKDITFKDLDLLHNINPDKFKGLVVTATNKKTGELEIFNAKDTPNVEVALATKASAALPMVFDPVKINGVEYEDGGYRDNIPTKYFHDVDNQPELVKSKKQVFAPEKDRVLSLAFGSYDKKDRGNIAIYSQKQNPSDWSTLGKFGANVLFKMINGTGGNFTYTKGEDKTYQEMRNNALVDAST